MNSDTIELESLEVFKIQDGELSYLYYPTLKIINVEYYDNNEDCDFFITIYYDGQFHLDESPEKDLNKLNSYLSFFQNFK
jgi:hypothetical protein